MAWVDYIIVAAAGYLLGAIPFAVIIARACGVDIFKVGSGNPGATNVKRSCGKFAGNLCFILDASKGFVATAFPLYAHLFSVDFSDPQMLAYAGLVAAIVGHSFSVFIKFRRRQRRCGRHRRTFGYNVAGDFDIADIVGCRILFDAVRFFGVHCHGSRASGRGGFIVQVPWRARIHSNRNRGRDNIPPQKQYRPAD